MSRCTECSGWGRVSDPDPCTQGVSYHTCYACGGTGTAPEEEQPKERAANIMGGLLSDSSGGEKTPLEVVQDYLPSNYTAYEFEGPDGEEMIQIRGRDNAGWTMDGYVIPRLASANICAREVE